jgi:hypothetical protein
MHIKKIYKNEAKSRSLNLGKYPEAPAENCSQAEWDEYLKKVLAVKDGGTGKWKVGTGKWKVDEEPVTYKNYVHALAAIRSGYADEPNDLLGIQEYITEVINDFKEAGVKDAFQKTISYSEYVDSVTDPSGNTWN